MTKKDIRLFTIIGILSIAFRLSAFVVGLLMDWGSLYRILDIIGHILFLLLLLYVGRDLRHNYRMNAYSVYFFVFYSLLFTIVAALMTNRNFLYQLMSILLFFLALAFAIYLMKTVYKIFAIVFLSLLITMFLLPIIIAKFFDGYYFDIYKYFMILPVLYPAVLIFIVRGSVNKVYDEIESIGADMEITE
ncbi:MAG: hypothetical protein QM802_20180 [Agriterribacter sp.]